ncbi:ParA family protein [Bifidobacterium breve]|uniref:ParA family protein n=1 Tax=Bifidobacterium breve TaxID=1685 RepID=UPI002FD909AD
MRVALANAKGGVAKTTSCIYLAAVLARRGIEVAVYDADPQSSASLWAAAAEQAGDPLPFDVLPANMATLAHLGGAPATKEWSIIDAPPQGPLLDKTLAVADFVILPTSDSPMDLQQAWDTLDRARHATRAALLPVRVEANTNAWAQTLATLEQTDTARFDTFIAKRQPIKTSLGINPKQLYEYRELADELTRIAKKELA